MISKEQERVLREQAKLIADKYIPRRSKDRVQLRDYKTLYVPPYDPYSGNPYVNGTLQPPEISDGIWKQIKADK